MLGVLTLRNALEFVLLGWALVRLVRIRPASADAPLQDPVHRFRTGAPVSS